MYQQDGDYKDEKLDVAILASEIAEWSITRYGYFVNSSVDKLEMIKAFSEELSRLPRGCLRYIDEAKNKWIDLAHKRPPTMPDFLTMLRSFHNHYENEKYKPQLDNKIPDYWGRWQGCKTHEDKANFFRMFDEHKCPPATKYWIREDMRKDGISSKKIKQALGYGWS